jgi:uncharacterized membrane protein
MRATRSVLTFERFAGACRSAASAIGLAPGAFAYSNQIRRVVWFVAGCSALVAAALLVLWAASGFGSLGVSGHGLVALILGIVFTTALGIALMALSFYSDHGGESEDTARSDAATKGDAD